MTPTAQSDYRVDLEATFDRHWVAVARTSELIGRGAYRTCTVGSEPIVVLRNGKGEIRAHLNVCRHRGSQILQGAGRVKGLMCPYHGWLYSLDGELRGAPEMKYTEHFDKSQFSLVSFPATEWAGFAMLSVRPASETPVGVELNAAVVDELAAAVSARTWHSEVDLAWPDVLAAIAGRLADSWAVSASGDVLTGAGITDDVESVLLLRPSLLLIKHSGVWTSLSAAPGGPGHTLLMGSCLVPGAPEAEPGAEPVAPDLAERSRTLVRADLPGGAGPGTRAVSAAVRGWVAADREALTAA
jgi:nitrite reductase/ring-hydroxylating ferredoxin subunit